VLDDDTDPQNPGDVDGDDDFDANDSFLIHLVKLSGTDVQIDQSKGSSTLSANQIRININQMGLTGDVDGDDDFDANDSFLIHLVKLSGTDVQIDQSKGSSPLTAVQIRANISNLGASSGTASQVARSSPAVALVTREDKDLLPMVESTEVPQLSSQSNPTVGENATTVWESFRDWIDML
jgi:hypothetical protein